jgi:hypothetical protein
VTDEAKKQIVAYLRARPEGETQTAIVTAVHKDAKVSKDACKKALLELRADGGVVPAEVRKRAGKNYISHPALKLAPHLLTPAGPSAPVADLEAEADEAAAAADGGSGRETEQGPLGGRAEPRADEATAAQEVQATASNSACPAGDSRRARRGADQ